MFGVKIRDDSEYTRDHLLRGISQQNCERIAAKTDKRVGFTFLIIQNVGAKPISDLTLYLREDYSNNRLRKEFDVSKLKYRKAAVGLPRDRDPVTNLVSRFGRAREADIKLSELPEKTKFVARLEPGEKLIALLNVYVADKENLPAAYLFGTYNYQDATYSDGGQFRRVHIREPSRQNAARVEVPFGWMMQ